MKLINDTLNMLKRVYTYNLLIVFILAIISYYSLVTNIGYIILGLAIASINFLINSYVTSYVFTMRKDNPGALIYISLITRIALVCIIAMGIMRGSESGGLAFIGGYSLHFIGILMYSLRLRKNEVV